MNALNASKRDMTVTTEFDKRTRHVLSQIRTDRGLSWDEFADRVAQAGIEVSGGTVRGYEEGRTKKIPLTYVDAVCRTFEMSPAVFFSEDVPESAATDRDVEHQLAAIRRILLGDDKRLRTPQMPPHDPESLRRRFLASISDYSDLEVERICGLNHETVRQYRQGQWPTRGPNASTRGKMERFLQLHEQRRTAAATEAGELPPLSEGLISFAEQWEQDQEFRREYANQGWISLTEDAVRKLRGLGLVRYDDEIAWLAYKRAVAYDPETADDVSLDDLGLTIEPFVERAGVEQGGDSH